MKKIIYSLLLIGSVLTTSCVDLNQEPKSFLTEEDYIQLPHDLYQVEKAATGIYNDLWLENYGFNCRIMRLNICGDDFTTCPKPNNTLNYFIDMIPSISANDKDQATIWTNFYKVITSSNKLINGTPVPADPTEAAKYNAVLGEAYFMRALSYFYLVRIFGEIPLILDSNTALVSSPRTAVSDIYTKAIIPDLEKAIGSLPNKSRSGDSSTPSIWAAKVCLADVYMNMAGWPLKQGAATYKKAADLCENIITNANTAGLFLTNEYADLWKEAKKTDTNEHMFTIIHDANYNASQYGKSLWPRDYKGGGWADYLAEPAFMNKYPNDKRKTFNFMTEWETKTGIIQWQNSQDRLPVISKYHDYDKGAHGNSAQSNGLTPIYRYADVLFIYAEASNLATGTVNDLALTCLTDIQKRAGSALTTTRESVAFDDAVLAERGWEFFAEFRRWFDLVRKEKVSEVKADKWNGSLFKANNHYYLPIPSEQIQMTGWSNNAGY